MAGKFVNAVSIIFFSLTNMMIGFKKKAFRKILDVLYKAIYARSIENICSTDKLFQDYLLQEILLKVRFED